MFFFFLRPFCQDDDMDEKDKGDMAADGAAKTKKKKKKKKKAPEEAAGLVNDSHNTHTAERQMGLLQLFCLTEACLITCFKVSRFCTLHVCYRKPPTSVIQWSPAKSIVRDIFFLRVFFCVQLLVNSFSWLRRSTHNCIFSFDLLPRLV